MLYKIKSGGGLAIAAFMILAVWLGGLIAGAGRIFDGLLFIYAAVILISIVAIKNLYGVSVKYYFIFLSAGIASGALFIFYHAQKSSYLFPLRFFVFSAGYFSDYRWTGLIVYVAVIVIFYIFTQKNKR